MNIDEMLAGIELDILVAEALGYARTPITIGAEGIATEIEGPVFIVVKGVSTPGDDRVYVRQDTGGKFTRFAPSTDIAAAWEVVEHLAKSGIRLCIFDQLGYAVDEKTGDVTNDCLFRVEFMNVMAHERDELSEKIWCGVAEAVAAPLAICYAALKVMAG